MRLNVYTEELLPTNQNDLPIAEIVTAEYTSSRTGEKMTNYGLRIFFRSAPELHFIPGRDDDRSAVTIWCGSQEKNIFLFWDAIREKLHASTLDIWRKKTEKVQLEAERALTLGEQAIRDSGGIPG